MENGQANRQGIGNERAESGEPEGPITNYGKARTGFGLLPTLPNNKNWNRALAGLSYYICRWWLKIPHLWRLNIPQLYLYLALPSCG